MRNGLRILLLLALLMTIVAVGDVSATKPGLICNGDPHDTIPCSTFNNGTCIYTYNAAALDAAGFERLAREIGRASCRERV